MTEEQNTKLEEIIKSSLEQQRNIGIRIGMQVVSKVCLDKLHDNSKPIMSRILDVQHYCGIALKPGFLKSNDDDVVNTLKDALKDENDLQQ